MRIFSKTRLRTSAVLVYLDPNSKRGKQLDIVTCEYPPFLSRLADHTYKVAEGLQKLGVRAHVWAPGTENSDPESADAVTRSLGRFGLHRLLINDRLMGKAKDRCLLLQSEQPVETAEQLNQFAEDPEGVKRACAAAVPFYEKHFSVDRTVDAIAACLYPAGAPVYRTVKAL